jgi:transcription antitermination factor NusG
MNIDEHKTTDAIPLCKEVIPSCTEPALDALPEVMKPIPAGHSFTGVSTRNIPSSSKIELPHWYALRTTYGRERKAYEFITSQGVKAFYPTFTLVKMVKGKRKTVEVSRLPNLFFVYGTETEIKRWVYDNVHLPYVRFYYRHTHQNDQPHKEPLIVPDAQMSHLRLICGAAEANDVILSDKMVEKFRTGHLVRVVEGDFKGMVGRVARYQGQQRVGIVVDGLLTMATAYVPTAFLESV